MPKPHQPERPELCIAGPHSLRIDWDVLPCDPEVTASTVMVRIAGSQRWQKYDHVTHRLVTKGGSTVPMPSTDVTVEAVEEGLAYEASVATMNVEGWSDVSEPSASICIGEPRPRSVPSRPDPPIIAPPKEGKMKCSWTLPDACPPIEASQVQVHAVSKGERWLVDAANGKLVQSGRTTFAVPRCEANINGIEAGVEYVAVVCCRNAEGFGEYSAESEPVAWGGATNGGASCSALVLVQGAESAAPKLHPLPAESAIRVTWSLPEHAKSTLVKLRKVGDSNWHLCGGTALTAPTCEIVAPGIEEGIEYEATVSFLVNGNWTPDTDLSTPTCIGEKKKPGVPDVAKEPRMFPVDQSRMRIMWRIPTTVPLVTGAVVKFRCLGARKWQYVHPKTGALHDELSDALEVKAPANEVDVVDLPGGYRFEATVTLRNRLGQGPESLPSDPGCIGRPMTRLVQCQYCLIDYDMQHAVYTKGAENFMCPPCRFKAMDPFNSLIEPYGLLHCQMVTRKTLEFDLDIPDLKAWRKEDHAVWLRMIKIDSETCTQVWPTRISLEANGNKLLDIVEPEEGHVRRDIPKNISAGLKPGKNAIKICIEDEYIAGYGMALVRAVNRTVQQMASDITITNDEDSLLRIRNLVQEAKAKWDDDDDEISCVISNKLKLRCPLSFERVVVPVRGDLCQHLQCFGLGAYLESNLKMRALNNRWTCPVCGNVLRPRDLRIDGYVERMLVETPEHIDEVLIEEDGSYRIIDDGTTKPTTRAEPKDSPITDTSQLAARLFPEGDSLAMTAETIAIGDATRQPASKRPRRRRTTTVDGSDDDFEGLAETVAEDVD